MAFTGLERESLVVHGLGVKLGERVSGAAESGVHASIHLVQARGIRFPLLRHGPSFSFCFLVLIDFLPNTVFCFFLFCVCVRVNFISFVCNIELERKELRRVKEKVKERERKRAKGKERKES